MSNVSRHIGSLEVREREEKYFHLYLSEGQVEGVHNGERL